MTCSVFYCDIYVCMLANMKLKVARLFQVRNPNPDPSDSPSSHIASLTFFTW